MSDGNASVKVASVKAELELDYSQFLESLDTVKSAFEDFAEEVNRPLEIHLDDDNNIDELMDSISELRYEIESLGDIDIDNVTVDFSGDGIEELKNSIMEIRDEIQELNSTVIDLHTSADDVEETDYTLERLKAIIESINDKDINIRVNADGVITAKAEMQDLEDTEEETEKKSQGLGETLGTAIYAFQAVFESVKEIAEGSLEEFAQMQMAGRIASNVFGSFGDNVREFASTSMTSLGMSSGATMHYADMLGFALKAQGATEQSASEMSEQLVETADNMVLASGGSITMQQAVQTLTSAIAGQTYGLKSMGINITGVNKKWSPLQQSMYIMHQVISKVNKNFGSLSGNLNTTAGQIQIAKSTMEEFGESIGEVLAPQLREVNKVLEHLFDGFEHLSPAFKEGVVIAGEVGVALLGLAATVAVVSTAVDTLTDTFEDFELASLTNPIILAIAGITVAVGLLYEAWKHNWDGMRETIDDFAQDVKNVFHDIEDIFKGLDLQEISKNVSSVFDSFKLTIANTVGPSLHIIKSFFSSFKSLLNPFFKDLTEIGVIISQVLKIVAETIGNVVSIVMGALSSLSPTFHRLGDLISTFLTNKLKDLGVALKIISSDVLPLVERISIAITNLMVDVLTPIIHVINNITKAISHVTIFGHKLSSVLLDVATGIGGILLLRTGVIATMRGLANGFLSVVALGSNIMDVMSDMKDGIVGVVDTLPDLIEGFRDFNAVQAVTDALAQVDPMTWIADAIVALIAVVVLLYESWKHNWGGMRTTLEAVGGWIENKFKYLTEVINRWGEDIHNVINKVGKFFDNIGKGIGNFVKNSVHSLEQFGDKVKYVFTHFPEIVENKMKKFAKDVVKVFTVDIPHAIENIPHVLNVLVHEWAFDLGAMAGKIASFVVNTVIDFINLGEKIGEKLDEIIHDIINWGENMVSKGISIGERFLTETINFFEQLPGKIWSWLVNAYHFTVEWGENMINKAITIGERFLNEIINFFEQLPGRVWTWLVNAYNFVVTWGEIMINRAIFTGERFLHEVIQFFEQLPGRVETWLLNTISRVETWIGEMASKGAQAAENFGHAIVSGLENLPHEVYEIGVNILEGLWNGMKSMVGGLLSWIDSIGNSITSGFKSTFKIHSPSRRIYEEVGVWILPGISKAIEDGLPNLLNIISKQVDLMVNHMQRKIKTGVGSIQVPIPDEFNTLASRMSDNPLIWKQPNLDNANGEYLSNSTSNINNSNGGYANSTHHTYEIHVHTNSTDKEAIAKEVKRQIQLAHEGF
ncbi:hypothetical protein [Clostridium thermobutyricum]|uniref:hypothetical protein n=1 Tax=Clostridium thermobutyricum TaxID=29372 RepID=UPI0018AC1B95|nr:hypothetical protein [Clostridium thermobutyricum]